jgi:hypothetical protein
MGFMDKAKKLAEQAQEKLDEVQQNFNQGGSTPGQQAGARYDEHGRPIQEGPPAGTAPPPSGEPAPPAPAGEPPVAEAPASEAPASEAPAAEPPASEGGSPNSSPDPFKPLGQ